ncbi:restriction endonuclease subunit S [Methylomonas sp. HW2-6]|uniref:restriction endonuclease subunit S n=1 Tax=Methylomonas sp. HW2-6 TaxID=3376687 RepID=UPI004041A97C
MSDPRNSSKSGPTAPKPGAFMDVREANAKYLPTAERQIPKGYKQTEVGVIPEDWEVKRLKAISPSQSVGLVINPSTYVEDDGTVPMLVGSNIFPNKISWESARRISEISNQALPASRLFANDLVTVRVGDPGITAVIPRELDGCNCASVMIIRHHARFNSQWLCYVMNSKAGLSQIADVQYGTAQKQFNISDAINFIYAVPPRAEQDAIAEVLSDADALIEALEQLVAKKRQLKQGAMQELLTGKRRLPGFNGEWEIKLLGEIGESIIGLTYSPNDVRADGVLVLRSSNVQDGALSFQDNVYVELEISERIMVRASDILICVRNGSRDLIGKCAKIDDGCKGMTFGAFMSVFRTPFHNFVFHQFQSNVIKRQINEHLGATINQITNKSLNSFQIPFPKDEAEQTAIAQILTDMDAEIAELESKLAKARAIKQGMMQQLLTGKIRLV